MRRALRVLGTALVVLGVAALVWVVLVWRWEDPATSLYTSWQQRGLESAYDERAREFVLTAPDRETSSPATEAAAVADAARRYRQSLRRGEALGRLRIPRIGVDMLVVEGTDADSLKKGPGRYPGSALPGQRRLVYVAGHRTTYGAPFSHIDRLRPGDAVVLELPYATFDYRVTGHRIVAADALEVLRPGHRELLALQACHPRFFASHRWITYARPVRVTPRGAPAYRPADARAAA